MVASVSEAVVSQAVAGLPSVRDFEIFQFVKCACGSTRAAAREFHLSQTRIRQVVASVQKSFLAAVPPKSGDDSPDTRLVVAEQWAREQLEHLYGRAVRAFTESETADVHGNVVPGKPMFLLAAARIALWMAKVPVHALPAFREIEENDSTVPDDERRLDPHGPEFAQLRELLGRFERGQRQVDASGAPIGLSNNESAELKDHSPKEDCSLGAVSSESAASVEANATDATSDAPGSCDSCSAASKGATATSLLTAQLVSPPIDAAARSRGTVEEANRFAQRPPLNRKERRARERLRKRLLAKR